MPAAIGAAVLGELAIGAGEVVTTLVGYAVLSAASLGLTFAQILDEEAAHDGAERDPAA